MAIKLTPGQTLMMKIKRMGINGEGVANYKGKTIFVPGALAKEEVLVKITKVNPKFAEGELVKIRKESKFRVTPACSVYKKCGGCQLQHLAYDQQLVFKKELLKQALHKFKPAGYEEYKLLDTIGMEDPLHYRNKAQFQLRKTKKGIEAGLYRPNSHELVPIKDCLVQIPDTQKIINSVVELLNKYNISIYDEQRNNGWLRTLMVRTGIATGDAQLVLIATSGKFPEKHALVSEIIEENPELVSVMLNVQDKKTSLVMGDKTVKLWGEEAIVEQVGEVIFDLSARAFFQLNPKQTKVLYEEGIKAADLTKDDTVIDAYSGVGTIGLSFASRVKEVRGMDITPQAIDDAKQNVRRMGLENARYEVGTAEALIPKWLKQGFKPTAIIVDPPRTGLDATLVDTLVHYAPERLVYISCNVSTLARDLVKLSETFNVEYLQSVDMFPQTARCEVVVKMTRK
jgi:23S rRNA (uracil-5-)-methyltransferase RumA